MAPAVATYEPRDPSHTVLYRVIAEHLETFLASLATDPNARGLPAYVQREFYDYLQCGILAHGFLRLGCDTCKQEVLLAFSCKRRGFCPSCAGRRMAQTAAHLVERVIPWVPTRQWVVSVPIPLRYWMSSSKDLTATVHTPRQQGVGGDEANTGTPRWNWARLLGRVFTLDMATCPFCRRSSLRIMATITHEAVITRILRHLNLASVPPPIVPTRSRQETFDWVA